MEHLNITDVQYTQTLLVQIAILYTIAALCFFTKKPSNQYSSPYFKAFIIYGVAMVVWGSALIIMRSPSCSGDWSPAVREGVWVSVYYLFVRLLITSVTLILAPTSNIRIPSIISRWLVISIILMLSSMSINSSYHNIALWGCKLFTILDSFYMCYIEFRSYKKTKRELSKYYLDANIIWVKEILGMLIIWITIGFFISFSDVVARTVFAGYGIILYPYIFIMYSINLKKLYFLHKSGYFESTEVSEDNVQESNKEIIEKALKVGAINISTIEQSVNKWIEDKNYLNEVVSIDSLASYASTNKTYMSSYINKTYGCNFRFWIASLRLKYAKELLKNDKTISVTEVAEAVYYTPNSFSTIFKKHFGITISQWRNEN